MYPEALVLPMKAELVSAGFEDITTPAQVDEVLKNEGTVLMVLNFVCGCAAGACRPGVKMSLDHAKKPSKLTTVFAGFASWHPATSRFAQPPETTPGQERPERIC